MSDIGSPSAERLLYEPRQFKRGEYMHVFEQQKQLENYGIRASRKKSVPEPWKNTYQPTASSSPSSSFINSPIHSRPVSAQSSRASSPPNYSSPTFQRDVSTPGSPSVKLTTVSSKKTTYNRNQFTVDHFSGFVAEESDSRSTRKKRIDTKPSEVLFGGDEKVTSTPISNQQPQQQKFKGMYKEQLIAEARQQVESSKQDTKEEMRTQIEKTTKNLLRKDLDLSKQFSQVQPHFHEPRKDWDLKQMNFTIAGKPISDDSVQPPAPKQIQPRISIERRRAKEYTLLKIP